MKKLVCMFVLIIVMAVPSTSFASLFDDLKNNSNYIYCGHTGSGFAIFLVKRQ